MYAYRLKSTRDSSQKFGPCECCGKHVSEVFIQAEMRATEDGRYTYHGIEDTHVFGHRDCLIARQRTH
jgi:hypothetical protein